MELEVLVNSQDIKIQSNLDELQSFVTELKSSYVSKPITAENVREAKSTLAEFRKIKTAISGKMTSVKEELLAPFEAVNGKVKEIVSELDFIEVEMKSGIDAVVEAERQAKHQRVLEILEKEKAELHPEIRLLVEDYYDEKWDNKTCSESSIISDFVGICDKARATFNTIRNNEHKAQLIGVFRTNFSYQDVERAVEQYRLEDELLARAQKAVEDSTVVVEENKVVVETAVPPLEEAVTGQMAQPILAAQFIICGTQLEITKAIDAVKKAGCTIKRNSQVKKVDEAYKASLN